MSNKDKDLEVDHAMTEFESGKDYILTFKDQHILSFDAEEDVLENVEL